MNIIQNIIKNWRLRVYLKREKDRIPILLETIDTIKRNYKKAKENNLEHYVIFYNVCLFILVMEYDMSVLIQSYIKEYEKNWENKYFARQMVLLLYEVSEDITQILGREFRASLKTIPLWDGAEKEINKISKEINQFKASNHGKLEEIRNFVIAHRDHDAIKQLEIIDNLNSNNINELLVDFYGIFNPLVPFMTRVVNIMGDPRVMLHHISEGMIKNGWKL